VSAPRLPDPLASIDRDWVSRRGLPEFVRRSWRRVEARPLVWTRHLDAICEHLTALTRREIRDLVINVPPGMSKSLVASVLWPAWVWTLDQDVHETAGPGHRLLAASYAESVALRDARKMRTLVDSDWFRARWRAVVLSADSSMSNAAGEFHTTAGGMRYSDTIGGQWTGNHGDTTLVDDPIDPMSAASASGAALDRVDDWWTGVMPTRVGNHRTSARALIMQRIHQRDLTKTFVANGATVLCLPMRFERAHPLRYAKDWRTEEGELLAPERVPEESVKALEKILGPSRAAAQLQQRPAAAGGNVFQRKWVQNYWTVLPPGGNWAFSVDCAFKSTDDSDFVCIQVWYTVGACYYLVDQLLERLDFVGTCKALLAWSKKYPKATKKLVEDKANGTAVINAMKRQVNGLIAIEPEGGKEARAQAAQPLFEALNVFVPHPTRAEYDDGRRGAPWVRGLGVAPDAEEAAEGSYEYSMVTFPNAANDDDVDATTQFLNHAAPGYAAKLEAAMAAVFGGQ